MDFYVVYIRLVSRCGIFEYRIGPNIRRGFFSNTASWDGSPCYWVLKNKYEKDVYEKFQLLILIIFVKMRTIIFKVLNFELFFLKSIVFTYFCLQP
jgi:hypothetical protein